MGNCTPEDQTAMVTPVTTLIGGLLSMAGGVAAIVLGTQANDNEEGSGNTTINAGAAMITGGFVAMSGAITWLAFKCREIAVRDDSDSDSDSEDSSSTSSSSDDESEGADAQEMTQIADNLDQMEQGLSGEADRVGHLVGPANDDGGQ
ncbi:hypothetical protein [Actinophytocola glycyrrhizae]|uniref:Uncharacterized protein n=1 Tax=Actinophytocola glycyrrhizae TaxID=2044873 RepID=A0ABV9RW45_9PSEU